VRLQAGRAVHEHHSPLTLAQVLWELLPIKARQISIKSFEMDMRNRNLSLAMLGLGGLGVLGILAAGTERGRGLIRALAEGFSETPQRLQEWNESAQSELENIQIAINELADALGSAHVAE
jgi:hypothetical protein